MPRSLRHALDATLSRLRLRGRAAVGRALRLAGAASAAFAAAIALFPGPLPILAPLTALLVVEITLKDSVTSSLQRVASVVAGVCIALLFANVVGLTWWSMGALVAVAIMVGQLLRLGPHLLEVPISAMLVLAVGGGAEAVAGDRIAETLLGAAIGVLLNVLLPPAVGDAAAARAVHRLAGELARLLRAASRELTDPITEAQVMRWMDDARALSRAVPDADKVLRRAEAGRRLNPRALLLPDIGESLRVELEALERTIVTVRSMFRSVLDGVRQRPTVDPDEGRPVRLAFAALLTDVAAGVDTFGRLALDQGTGDVTGTEADLAAALVRMRRARDEAAEVRRQDADTRDWDNGWELSEPVLQAVERVLWDLDVRTDPKPAAVRGLLAGAASTARPLGRALRATGRLAPHPVRARDGHRPPLRPGEGGSRRPFPAGRPAPGSRPSAGQPVTPHRPTAPGRPGPR